MTADRPATEPRTEAGRNLLGWRDAEHVAFISDIENVAMSHDEVRQYIIAIEAEAAQGAAPLRQTTVNDDKISHEGAAPRAEAAEGTAPREDDAPCNECGKPMDDTEMRLLDKNCLHRLRVASEGAAPRAEGRPRLFYSGTHGSTCPNCERFVAGERYHIPDVMGYTGPPGACMERRPDEPILPANWAAPRAEGLDAQADDLLKACYERNIYSRGDMEYAFQPWALDVERLRRIMHPSGCTVSGCHATEWEYVRDEYTRSSDERVPEEAE